MTEEQHRQWTMNFILEIKKCYYRDNLDREALIYVINKAIQDYESMRNDK